MLLTSGAWPLPMALADGDGPPAAPILRVETGGHTASIKSMGVDAAGRYLVTGSSDKTVRVWDARDGSAISVLRPPIGDGQEGLIYGVAISPDGSTVVCGGETGYAWDKTHSVYVFDRATGRLVHKISGLPSTVHCLAYSANGSYVAVGIGHEGIRLYRTSDWEQIGDDTGQGVDRRPADAGHNDTVVGARLSDRIC